MLAVLPELDYSAIGFRHVNERQEGLRRRQSQAGVGPDIPITPNAHPIACPHELANPDVEGIGLRVSPIVPDQGLRVLDDRAVAWDPHISLHRQNR